MLNLLPRSWDGSMTVGARIAHGAAAGPRRRRALDARALVILMVAWLIAPGAVGADTLLLRSGERIDGSIIDATRNTVVVRRAIGGMRQMGIRDIEQVRIDLAEGQSISGSILSWVDGVYRIRVGDEVVSIRAGRIVSRAPYAEASRQLPATPPPSPPQQPTNETRAAPAAAAAERAAAQRAAAGRAAAQRAAVERAAAERAAAEKAAAERVAAERAAAQRAAAQRAAAERAAPQRDAPRRSTDKPQIVAVKASVAPAEAGATGLVFRIELSRPAEQTVVLIYGTVDGTAKAGKDYEPRQGIVTLAPGTRTADVYVPLIEPQLRQGGTQFDLFLTADPEVAQVVDERITATVPGEG